MFPQQVPPEPKGEPETWSLEDLRAYLKAVSQNTCVRIRAVIANGDLERRHRGLFRDERGAVGKSEEG